MFDTEVKKGVRFLKKVDPILKKTIEECGPCTLTPQKRSVFEALIRAIAHQQLHGKAAETILGRFISLYGTAKKFSTAEQILKTPHATLRSVGFSENKVKAIYDIATKSKSKEIPRDAVIRKMSNEEIIAALVPLRGVGKWTVEMYLIFTLGRLDVLPVDDFGVREGYKILYKKRAQPTTKQLANYGEKFAPYRSILAWYFWRIADMAKSK